MTWLDQIRKAMNLTSWARELLAEAEELSDIGEGLWPPGFPDVEAFEQEITGMCRRAEAYAERKWLSGGVEPCQS